MYLGRREQQRLAANPESVASSDGDDFDSRSRSSSPKRAHRRVPGRGRHDHPGVCFGRLPLRWWNDELIVHLTSARTTCHATCHHMWLHNKFKGVHLRQGLHCIGWIIPQALGASLQHLPTLSHAMPACSSDTKMRAWANTGSPFAEHAHSMQEEHSSSPQPAGHAGHTVLPAAMSAPASEVPLPISKGSREGPRPEAPPAELQSAPSAPATEFPSKLHEKQASDLRSIKCAALPLFAATAEGSCHQPAVG